MQYKFLNDKYISHANSNGATWNLMEATKIMR